MFQESIVLKHFPNLPAQRYRRDRREAEIVVGLVPTKKRDAGVDELLLEAQEPTHVRNADVHDVGNAADARMLERKMQRRMKRLNALNFRGKVLPDENVQVGFRNLCHDERISFFLPRVKP